MAGETYSRGCEEDEAEKEDECNEGAVGDHGCGSG